MVIDDYKKVDIKDTSVVSLLHNYSDGHGRARMKANGDNQKTWPIRGTLTATGEDMPASGEASVQARMIIIPVLGSGDSSKLTKGQLHAKHLPGVMAKFIQNLCNKKWKEDEIFNIMVSKKQMFSSAGCHNRTAEALAVNSFAWDMAAEFLGLEDLSKVYYHNIMETRDRITSIAKQEQAGNVFINCVKDMLSGGGYYLEGLRGCNSTVHDPNAKRLGWSTEECDMLLGSIALGEVNTFRQRLTGSPINYSQQAIYAQLLNDGIIIPSKEGDPTDVRKIDGGSKRVVKIKKGVLTDIETPSYDAQYANSEVRSEEECPLLN